MELDAAKRRRLVSSYATIRHVLLQMEEAARDGRSPTGLGSPLTPLPSECSEPVLAPLRELEARLHEFARRLAPSELAALEHPQGTSNTLVWLSNLLDRIRYVVDDLHPSRLDRYGPVSQYGRDVLRVLHEELSNHLSSSRAALDGFGIASTDGEETSGSR